MAATATTVEIFTPDQWAQRLLRLYPNKWTGDAAKTAGGILYSLFNAQSTSYNFLQNGLDWVLNACRIATAQDVALDAIANDYFGSVAQFEATVVRQPGEPDDSFRARIYANLLQSGGTRADIIRVVELLTGQIPRITEPWNVLDNGACDSISFCDIDTQANPCRVGDLNFPYQGFVESILPSFGGQGNNPVYCIDDGLSCDRSFIIDPQSTWFLGEKELDAAINRVRMFSTIVYRKYGSTLTANYARGNSPTPGSSVASVAVSLSPPCSQALVVLACASWGSTISAAATDDGDFVLTFGTDAPGDESIDWIAAPATLPGFGLLPITQGVTTASIAMPIPGQLLLVTPNWDTSVWLSAIESGTASFNFGTAAPAGAFLNYGSFATPNAETQSVNSGASSGSVTFPSPITNSYQLILLPGWNTEFEITKTSNGFTATFTTSPGANSLLCWGVLNQPY